MTLPIAPPRPEAQPPTTALEALRRTPWLADVPETTLQHLAGHAMLHLTPAGVRLFEQADIPAFAKLLLSGTVELLAVRGDEETLVELVQPVELILPAAAVSGQPYLVRGRVHAAAHLLLISADALRQAITRDHALCLAVLACQAAQFRRQIKIAKSVRLRSAEERVGAYLLSLCEATSQAKAVRLPVEKRLIASQLGMTRETFSRALPKMAAFGLHVTGDTVRFDDLAAARAAFPFDPLIDGPEPIHPLPISRSLS